MTGSSRAPPRSARLPAGPGAGGREAGRGRYPGAAPSGGARDASGAGPGASPVRPPVRARLRIEPPEGRLGPAVRRRFRLPGGEAGEPPREGAPDRGDQEVVHCPRLPEPHLVLARMHVDVHQGRVHREEQHRDRVATGREPPVQGNPHGMCERPVADPPSVQEEVLPGGGARPDPPPKVEPVRRRPDRCSRRREPAADDLVETPLLAPCPKDSAPAVDQTERDVRAGEGEAPNDVRHVLELGALRPQEPPPGRHVVEEILHVHRRPRRVTGRLRVAALSAHPPAGVLAGRARGEGEPRHRRDARERLAPEPETGDPKEVVDGGDLARRMALEGEGEFRAPDPAPVVGHPDPPGAARLELDGDGARPRVQAVLDELLHHRRGPFDHLPGRELARDLRRQARDRRRDGRFRTDAGETPGGAAPGLRASLAHPAPLPALRSSVAMDSTCEVGGNMSARASARSR